MAPELQHGLRRILGAIRAAEAGPSAADLAEAPLLEDWRVLISPYGSPVLWGQVSGHPRLGDTMMTTSRLIAIDTKAGWARSISRWFRLGDPIAGSRMRDHPPATLSEAKPGLIVFEFGSFFPLDNPALLDSILADFIAQARKAAVAQGIGGRDEDV